MQSVRLLFIWAIGLYGFVPGHEVAEITGQKVPVIEYTTDKSVDVTVYLVYNTHSVAEYYTARLQSPVCMENLCNPIDIEIQWDLLGYFKDYIENPEDPVTKFDHQPFSEDDHKKLKSILANTESLLQDYRMEDLVDTSVQIYSEELDATTGATNKTFENDIVTGAIYTCYTLWTFVNGDLRNRILHHTESILNDDIISSMIQSDRKNYLDYIFDHLSDHYSSRVNKMIGSLIWHEDPLVSVKAINAVDEVYWQSDTVNHLLEKHFPQLQNPVQNALIRNFLKPIENQGVLSSFISLLPNMPSRQQQQVYEMILLNKELVDDQMKEKLMHLFKSPEMSLSAKEYELMSKLNIPH